MNHYLSLAFSSPSPSKRSKRKNGTIGRGTRLGESSFVDATKDGEDEDEFERGDEEEEEEEEEWDFV